MRLRGVLKIVAPFLVLGTGAWIALKVLDSKPEVESVAPPATSPFVSVIEARRHDRQLVLASQGTVVPRTESELIAEVAGKIEFASPALVAGGFFQEGQLLVRLEQTDYELALIRAEAEVESAKLKLEQEKAEAEVARAEWEEMGRGKAGPLVLREPQLRQAEAALAAAEASVKQARRSLSKTDLLAPFTGRVRRESVDVGQFVNRGTSLAQLYAVDIAEVRLPVPDEELAFVDLPMIDRPDPLSQSGPRVTLHARFAGEEMTWHGRIVRTEGEIDPETRMVYLIAQVEDPYELVSDKAPTRPLAVGLFVEARIYGKHLKDVVVLPREALHGDDTVLIVDSEDRLRYRDIDVLRIERNEVVLGAGVQPGEWVCVTAPPAVVDGMRVAVSRQKSSESY